MINDVFNTYRDLVEMPDREEETTKEEREKMAFITAAYGCATYVMALVVGLLICLLLGSCTTTEYVIVPEHHTDTLRQVVVRHDSVMVHDSLHVTETGDTVTSDRWHTQYIERSVHDTAYISKVDSVPYPVTMVKEIPAELTWWQQTRIHIANILLWLVVMLAGLSLLRKALSIKH